MHAGELPEPLPGQGSPFAEASWATALCPPKALTFPYRRCHCRLVPAGHPARRARPTAAGGAGCRTPSSQGQPSGGCGDGAPRPHPGKQGDAQRQPRAKGMAAHLPCSWLSLPAGGLYRPGCVTNCAGCERGFQALHRPRQAQPGCVWLGDVSYTACRMILATGSRLDAASTSPALRLAVNCTPPAACCPALPCWPAGVGAYRTEELQPYVLKVVRKVGAACGRRWAGLAELRSAAGGAWRVVFGVLAVAEPQSSSVVHRWRRRRSACWRLMRTRSTFPLVGP